MGYDASVNAIDVSNTNTPGVIDPTDPVPGTAYRVVADLNREGRFRFTLTNAYSGNNGRAAVRNDDARVDYLAGNAGNGADPQPPGIIIGAGAQILTPTHLPESDQTPGQPTPVGSFNITQIPGNKPDKVGKDTNFRGMTIAGNVLYYTKGSGGNGINTVYFVDTTGSACPTGVGLPQPGAQLPTSPIAYDPTVLQTKGVTPYNMCILKGFPTATKSKTRSRSGSGSPTTTRRTSQTRATATPRSTRRVARTREPPRRRRRASRSGCSTRRSAPGSSHTPSRAG
jgi:hypothetical protein